jgi:phosphatidylserine decarboxylase
MGMIKFGSTTELILPQAAAPDVRVKVGDRVKGGVTVLASVPLLPARRLSSLPA